MSCTAFSILRTADDDDDDDVDSDVDTDVDADVDDTGVVDVVAKR